jgi:hypothetical protein
MEGKIGRIRRVKYWEIIANNLSKARLGHGAASQAWILAGERSSLLTRIAATVNASLCERMKS